MTWIRANLTALVSSDGRYSIARVVVGELPRYELWRSAHDGKPAQMLSTHASADEAKAALTMKVAA